MIGRFLDWLDYVNRRAGCLIFGHDRCDCCSHCTWCGVDLPPWEGEGE